jgi:hypothetical protein
MTPLPTHHPHRARRPAALLAGEPVTVQLDDPGSIFERWMRRWTGPVRTESSARGPLSERRRLLAVRRLIATDLSPHSAEFSRRDTRLYLCLVSASTLASLTLLRFDLFDLLCRYIGEGAATARLHEIDAWLTPRR